MGRFLTIWRKAMPTFDPLVFPLSGRRLIEAAAGTGKTYSIALLYLRLILEKRLEVDAILVVTFTTSATEELRGRIRVRLREALDFLEGRHSVCQQEDQILVDFLSAVNDRQEARILLSDALTRMDEAAIYTIHGFCRRMLQDHAFESGAPFEVEFLENEQPLRRRIIEDFWRSRFYSVSSEEAAWAVKQWDGPGGLLKVLDNVLCQTEVTCVPDVSDEALCELYRLTESALRDVRQAWSQCREEVGDILTHDTALRRDQKKGYGPERLARAMAGMDLLAGTRDMVWELPDCCELLAASVMAKRLKKKKIAPRHPFFQMFDRFYLDLGEWLRAARAHVLMNAWKFLRFELEQRKREQAGISFNDLLTGLDSALAGPGGAGLVRCIRARYAAALVDEFQDTDPLQYRIFKKIFGSDQDSALFMIGDPKQAIYSFRGADIFTYIRAKKDVSDPGPFTMSTNYRSTAAMVEAVNRLFDRAASFVFDQDIPFFPARAGGKADEKPLLLDGAAPVPLTALILSRDRLASKTKTSMAKTIAKNRAEGPAARWCAAEIARLLAMGSRGTAMIGDEPVTGRYIAVLVRTHHEADIMQQVLRERNIASVFYSRDSVFETDEARQMQQVLSALVDSDDEPQVRSACVTDLFGIDGYELDQLVHNDAAWAGLLGRMRKYRELWQQRGLMPMFRVLATEQQVVRRLLARPGGERRLTNFLHLAELLQEASARHPGMDGLLRWLNDERRDPEKEAADAQLRLESDENLVHIVTIHKAKGLEYPLVFLPFLWSCRKVKDHDIFAFHDPSADDRVTVDLGSGNEEHHRLAERERLAEDLRLLYVAVTRARYCCYWCWGKINDMESTALAWLLHRDGGDAVPNNLDEQRIRDDIATLNKGARIVNLVENPDSFAETALFEEEAVAPLSVKIFQGSVNSGWRISSYSQLTAAHDAQSQTAGDQPDRQAAPTADSDRTAFSFPRGPAAGTCLHGLLEQLDFPGAGGREMEELARDRLWRAGFDTRWTPVVCQWLADVLETRLDPETNLSLRQVSGADRLVEMGFYFALDDLDMDRFNGILADFALRPIEFQISRLQGLMKGFIDLVFRFQGRFFIADYKSNYLGARLRDYRTDQLGRAMEEHRYDLQYLIYTLALHRYLGRRIRDYDYDRYFGGVYYLFLRGMDPAAGPGNGVYFARPPRELIERFDACCRGREGR